MLRRHFSTKKSFSSTSLSSSCAATSTAAVTASAVRGILSGPGAGSFGGVHEQKVKGGLTGELKRGFKREVIDERERRIREKIQAEKKEQEEAGIRQTKVEYTKDEQRAEATKEKRAQKGAFFMEHSDEAEYHTDKQFEAAGKVAPSVEREQESVVGGYHYDPEEGAARELTRDEAKRVFHENLDAEQKRAEGREFRTKQAEERYRAYAKREPGRPLPGSKIEQRQKEKELGDFFMDNPDIAVGRPTLWISAGIMLSIFAGMAWSKDREGPLWDGAPYPEDVAGAKQSGIEEIAAAAVTFRQIAGEEKTDSYQFHTAINAPPRKYDNIFFPEARKTPAP